MKAVSAQVVSCCVCQKPPKVMQNMHGNIPYMFDCWADPVAHRFPLKSSMLTLNTLEESDRERERGTHTVREGRERERGMWKYL